jgi:glutathione peroxidase
MKALIILLSLVTFTTMAQSTSIYDYSFVDIDGETISLEQFKAKKILFINVASRCGFTDQYKGLQELHEQFGKNVILIGFPCDQFAGQEPGSEAEIKAFCQKKFGVTFLMASKIDVKGENQHPIYKWLTQKELNEVESSKVAWNFSKYLVDGKGKYVAHFGSKIKPMSIEITNTLE